MIVPLRQESSTVGGKTSPVGGEPLRWGASTAGGETSAMQEER